MKKHVALAAAALLVIACNPLPTPSSSPTGAPSLSPRPTGPAYAVDCGRVTDPASCGAAVEVALRLTGVTKAQVRAVVIEAVLAPTCPGAGDCAIPTAVRVLGADGQLLAQTLLTQTSDGGWTGYPVALPTT